MGRAVTGASLVMRGMLSEFSLADVLQAVSMSRQFTAIELLGLDGRNDGVVWLKSGHVIAAQRGSVHGRLAFYELFRAMAEVFVVFRLEDPPTFNAPIGRLPELILEAVGNSRAPAGSQVGPRPVADPARVVRRPITSTGPHASSIPPASSGRAALPARSPAVVRRERPAGSVHAPAPVLMHAPAPVASAPVARAGMVVAVCSPKGGVGKTTIALNLSVSVAQRGLSVVLVDADINGDQLALLDARDRAPLGVFDLLDRPEALDSALRQTASPTLRLLPASGPELCAAALERRDQGEAWRAVLDAVGARADIVLVDCPAGMFGTTLDVLGAASHVVGVFQSEMVAQRSFNMFTRGLAAVPPARRPELLGVVVNMFQRRSGPSLEAFQAFCEEGERHRLFETMIPRSEAFASASLAGQPLRFAEGEAPSPVAWLFDMLADEVFTRSGLRATAGTRSPSSFLL